MINGINRMLNKLARRAVDKNRRVNELILQDDRSTPEMRARARHRLEQNAIVTKTVDTVESEVARHSREKHKRRARKGMNQ